MKKNTRDLSCFDLTQERYSQENLLNRNLDLGSKLEDWETINEDLEFEIKELKKMQKVEISLNEYILLYRIKLLSESTLNAKSNNKQVQLQEVIRDYNYKYDKY